jgi:hypothetical protein
MTTAKHIIEIMQKAARCWSGYEPVPGAKAYSEGSCRPKGSKKTKKEVIQGKDHAEKKAANFDVEHARRVFTENPIPGLDPVKATPMQLWNRTKAIVRPDSNHRSSNAANLMRQQYNNQMPNMPQPTASPQPPQVQAPQAPTQTAATAVKPPAPPAPVTSPQPSPPPAASRPRPKVRQMPADPVPAIDARLQRKGIDPSKPVFAKAAPKPPVTPQIVQNVTRPKEQLAPMTPPPLKRVSPTMPPVDGRVPTALPQPPRQLFAQTPMR